MAIIVDTRSASKDPTVEELLRVAIQEGGAVGEAAEAFMNPRKSIFATSTEKAAGALSAFINTLQTGSFAVAGLIDRDMSVADAIKNKITPSDLLIDRPQLGANNWEKASYQLKSFALDTLLDPLTYVTFGAGRGILGLTKGAEAIANAKLAEQLGTKLGNRVALSETGEELGNKFMQAKRNGLREQFLRDQRFKLSSKGLSGDDLDNAIKALDDETSDFLIAETLNAPFDSNYGAQMVANMVGRKGFEVQGLKDTLIDKGGIKFFGQSMLSGQRIRKVAEFLPGMTLLDRATQPVRGFIGNTFSTNFANGQRLPDDLIDERQKWENLRQSLGNHIVRDAVRLKTQLNLSTEEWEFITAAVENGLKPADKKAADVWRLVHGQDPQNGTIREAVWKGFLDVQRFNKETRNRLRESGLKVPDRPNYMPHLFLDEEVVTASFRNSAKKETSERLKFAKISTLIDEQGERVPVRLSSIPDKQGNLTGTIIEDGKEVVKRLRYINKGAEKDRILTLANSKTEAITKELTDVVKDIRSARTEIKGKVAENLVDDVVKLLDDIPELTKMDKSAIASAVAKSVKDSDVDAIVSRSVKRNYKDGVKFANGTSVTQGQIDKLTSDLVIAKGDATAIASRINKLLKSNPKLPHQKTAAVASKKADNQINKLAKELKKQADEIRKKTLDRKIDSKSVEELLTQVVARTSKNPQGLSRIIDKLIKNKQLAQDLKDDIEDISRSVELDLDRIEEVGGKFIDEQGKVFERIRSTVQEARTLGSNFENNALVIALLSAKEAIDVSVARNFMGELASKYGVPASRALSDYVPIEKTGILHEGRDLAAYMASKDGEEMYFPPTIAKHIQNFTEAIASETSDGSIKAALNAYDGLQNWFKAAVTALFPAFHGRNALSNVFLMYNVIGREALNPANHVASANFLNMERRTQSLKRAMARGDAGSAQEYAKMMGERVFKDRTGYDWTWGELRRELTDNVIAFHPRNVGQVDQLKFGRQQVREAAEKLFPKTKTGKIAKAIKPANPFDLDNSLFKFGFALGQGIEDYSRTLTFLSQLKKTGDPLQAARMTKMALFDYSNLTKFEKEVMRRIVPFYSFTRKNLELQVKTLMTNPGRIAQEIRAVQSLGDAFTGDTLTEKEIEALPEWAKEGYNLVRSREGSHVTLLKTLGTPLEEIFQRTNAQSNLGIISPLIKAPFELASGYSFFHGMPISEVTQADAYARAPKAIQDFVGYHEVTYKDANGVEQVYHTAFKPENMYLVNNLQPVGRIFSEIARIDKQETQTAKLMTLFFGAGERTFDIQREQEKRMLENKQRLETLLDQAGLGYTFTKFVQTSE